MNTLPTREDEHVIITIPEDKIKPIIDLADDHVLWVKLVDGGFQAEDKIVPEIIGQILDTNLYWIAWGNDKKPIKQRYEGEDAPGDEYEIRCDLKLNVNGHLIGISLSRSSTKNNLSPYLLFLFQKGFQPSDVLTRIRSKSVSNQYGRFNVAVFEAVGSLEDRKAKSPQPPPEHKHPVTPPDVPESIMQEAKVSQPGNKNPWA